MKINYLSLTLLYILLLMSSLHAQSAWSWQNPLPQGADMHVVFPLSANRAIITGNGGTLMTTENGGQEWSLQRVPQTYILWKASFISEYEGWLVGKNFDVTAFVDTAREVNQCKIFKTYDAGKSWTELTLSIDLDFSIYDIDGIEFINKKSGYLIANPRSPDQEEQPGLIFKTEDGGIHWIRINTGLNRKYFQILFTDTLNGFLLSQPSYTSYYFKEAILHRTTDAGKTWITMKDTGFGPIKFINNSIGWAGNYKTEDMGQTWNYKELNFPQLPHGIDKIAFADSVTIYAISYKTILKSDDEGNTWTIQAEMKDGLLRDIEFYDSEIGYSCGYGGTIYYTSDGGLNWKRYGKGTTGDLHDVFFINENRGWCAGNDGTVLSTLNSGDVWEKQVVPAECSSAIFRGIYFIDNEKGWLSGDGYILNTYDGGSNWHLQAEENLSIGGRFNDIIFLDENIGYAIGQIGFFKGLINRTTDGGATWLRIDENNLPSLNKIAFADKDNGWICGSGIILSTNDGGMSWQSKFISENFRYMQFTDYANGWVTSQDEISLYHTADSGITWSELSFRNRFYLALNSFYFFNRKQGLGFSLVLPDLVSTNNGGADWEYREKLPTGNINAVTFVNDSIGWAVGRNGAIIKFHKSYFNITSVDTFDNVSTSSNVSGIYPNPFNSTTTIYFELTKPQEVYISIYNVLGECIEKFQIFGNSGINYKQWEALNTNSGVYLVKIDSIEFSKTIKIILIK